MAEYQGMDFEAIDYKTDISEPVNTEDLLDFDYYLACQRYPEKNKIYVKKGSEYLVKPKEGDLTLLDKKEPCFVYKHSLIHKHRMSIVVRDSKQFFMPEVEND